MSATTVHEDLPSRNYETDVDKNVTEDHESGHESLIR